MVRTFENDRKVADFSLAVNETFTDRAGNKTERTEWFRISVWGSRAAVIEQYVSKGSALFVEGRLSLRTYQDTAGQTRYSLDVTCTDFTLIGNRPHDESSVLPSRGNSTSGTVNAQTAPPPDSDYRTGSEEDLPF